MARPTEVQYQRLLSSGAAMPFHPIILSAILPGLVALLVLWIMPAALVQQPAPRCFPETGFCVRDPAIQATFAAQGSEHTLGYPVSRELRLRGTKLQLFQRVGIEVRPDGRAATLDLLAPELLPLRSLDGSPLPEADPSLQERAPRPDEADFAKLAEAFIVAEVPDVWEGRPVAFLSTFRAAAGPGGSLAEAVPAYGWPTTGPRRDPFHPERVYQRFERTVLRYDGNSGQTAPLALGDYVKSALVGGDLPVHLLTAGANSGLLGQYHPFAIDGLHRPWDLPDSDLENAFRPDISQHTEVLLLDGFGPQSAWPQSSSEDGATVEFVDGSYFIGVERAGTPDLAASAAVSDLRPLDDFVVVLDVRLETPAEAGWALHLRRQASDDRLTLVVDASRRLANVYRQVNGRTETLLHWSPIPPLRYPTLPNRFTIRAVGPHVQAIVNGMPLFQVSAGDPRERSLWLSAITWGQPTRVSFENLRISATE